jgi:lysophospholipase L1-like esterase
MSRLIFTAGLIAALTLTASAEQRAWRIMPVGDSITDGGKDAGYRSLLLGKLTAAGYRVQFVGTRGSDPLRHEGYGGKNAEFLATVVGKNFKAQPADIVLMHCGHNCSAEQKPVRGIIAATEKMIADFRKTNPKVIVLLAQVIPSGKLPKYAYIPELNQELAKLAKRLDVILVDQADGFDWKTDAVEDRVHPNAAGKEKMAVRWYAALKPILEEKSTRTAERQ